MPNQELIDYIKKAKEEGQGEESIKNALLQSGWSNTDVNEAFSESLANNPTSAKFSDASSYNNSTMKLIWPLVIPLFIGAYVIWVFATCSGFL